MQYEPYGETLVQRGSLDFAPKYNSQELDRETNFYFYNARYYDPLIARFTSADSVIDGARSTQGWNRFSYVAGNPVLYKDPTGHQTSQDGKSSKQSDGFSNIDAKLYEYPKMPEFPGKALFINRKPEIGGKCNINNLKTESEIQSKAQNDSLDSTIFGKYGGAGILFLGWKTLPKHGGIAGGGKSGKLTSIASKSLRTVEKALPKSLQRIPLPAKVAEVTGTRSVGGIAGRAVPFVGWFLMIFGSSGPLE